MGLLRTDENTPPSNHGSPGSSSGNAKLSAKKLMYGFTKTGLKAKKSLLSLFNSAQSSPDVQIRSKFPTRNVSTPDLPTTLERRNTISSVDERRLLPIATLTSSTRFSLWSNTLRHPSSRRPVQIADDIEGHETLMDTHLERSDATPTPDFFPIAPSVAPSVTLDQSEWGDFGSLWKTGNDITADIPRSSPIVVPSALKCTMGSDTPKPSRVIPQNFIVGSIPQEPSPFDDLVANEPSPTAVKSRSETLHISLAGSPLRFAVDPMPTPMPGTTMAMDEAYSDPIPPAYTDLYPISANPFPIASSCIASKPPDCGIGILGRSGDTLDRLREELNGIESTEGPTAKREPSEPNADPKDSLHSCSPPNSKTQMQSRLCTPSPRPARMGPKDEFERSRADRERRYEEANGSYHVEADCVPGRDVVDTPPSRSERCTSRLTQRSSNWGEAGLIPEYIQQARDHFGLFDDSPQSSSAAKHRRRLMRSKSLTDHQLQSDTSRSHASSHVSISHLESLKDLYLSSIDPRITESFAWFGLESQRCPKPPSVEGFAGTQEEGSSDDPRSPDDTPKSKSYYTDDPVLYDLMARIGTTVEDLAEVDLIHRLLVKARRKQKLRKALKGLSSPKPVVQPKVRRDRHSLPARFKGWFSRSPSKSGTMSEEATDEMICEIEARLYGRKSNKSLDSISDDSEITVTAEFEAHQTVLGIRGGGPALPRCDRPVNPYGGTQDILPASRSMPHDLHKTPWDGEANRDDLTSKSTGIPINSVETNAATSAGGSTRHTSENKTLSDCKLSEERLVEPSSKQGSVVPVSISQEIPAMPFTDPDDDDCYSRNSFGDTIRKALASDSETSSVDEASSIEYISGSKHTNAKRDTPPCDDDDDDEMLTHSRSKDVHSKFQTRSPTPPAHVLFRTISQKDSKTAAGKPLRPKSPPPTILGPLTESARLDDCGSDDESTTGLPAVHVVDIEENYVDSGEELNKWGLDTSPHPMNTGSIVEVHPVPPTSSDMHTT
ncbi:hypothetical protein EJ05DRAFT_263730 [Pseudovirgaria hyperparasitica]|uniref:Uncharacterized protein n=1 Tax=Pseudovirgaria hyperparasitica TaxID=470096 RepID=A0A6A6WGR0_9PEZI|nr:uncharacterized protein EJ05DRAFT_263730 [Pseudovirgaria hyperparasitica]KAF2761399.1 hypothetical protein EJ05DRAFT_263730 [Pseudovirgaria hyperparasitica]